MIALLLRYCGSYVIGISAAAAITALSGGSGTLLILYSLAAGLPFLIAALVLGAIFRRSIATNPGRWALAAPVGAAIIWLPLGFVLDGLLDPVRIGLYATFCAAACGIVFFATSRIWPIR